MGFNLQISYYYIDLKLLFFSIIKDINNFNSKFIFSFSFYYLYIIKYLIQLLDPSDSTKLIRLGNLDLKFIKIFLKNFSYKKSGYIYILVKYSKNLLYI